MAAGKPKSKAILAREKWRLQEWKIKTDHKHKNTNHIFYEKIECAKGSASDAVKDCFSFDPSGTETFLCWQKSIEASAAARGIEESNHVALAQSPVRQNIDEEQVLRRDCYNDYSLFVML
jgi:hypothetical protein